MALDKDRLGTAMKNAVLALNPNAGGMSGGENAQMLAYMKAIANEIINEFKNNGDIVLTADITIPAAGLISASPGSPVTGSALNAPVTLSSKIQ